MRFALTLMLFATVLAGCEQGTTPAGSASSPSSSPTQPQSLIACAPKRPDAPTAAANAGAAVLTVETDRGTVQASLDRTKTACTIAILTALAKRGTYDGKPCHRLPPMMALQCLGPAPDHEQELENLPSPMPPSPIAVPTVCEGEVNGKKIKFPCPSELIEAASKERMAMYPKGSVAMSRAGYLLFLAQDTELNAAYTIVGNVTSGMDVINHDQLTIKSVQVR